MNHVFVSVPEGAAGTLFSSPDSDLFRFRYGIDAAAGAAIAYGMPVRVEEYAGHGLMPVFQMNMPEGFMLEQIRNRLAKSTPLNPMLLLAITGSVDPIGRITVTAPGLNQMADLGGDPKGLRLDEILAWDGAENLFDMLLEKYVMRAGISGVQPKLLLPVIESKATAVIGEFIVKSQGRDYPHLAINEYLCMSIARQAGLDVPEFHLSKDHQLFVMRRFDRVDGQRLGFEDMAVLTGRGTAQKYDGSYEMLAKAVRMFCAPESVQSSLDALYRSVVVSCVVGNGDAHLKNFGILYSTPFAGDARLAPAYDIVNTTAYISEDALALSLAGNKSFFASRLGLLEFAKSCGVDDPAQVIEQTLESVELVLSQHQHLAQLAPAVANGIARSARDFDTTFRGSRIAMFKQMHNRVTEGAAVDECSSPSPKGPRL